MNGHQIYFIMIINHHKYVKTTFEIMGYVGDGDTHPGHTLTRDMNIHMYTIMVTTGY
jgi:hypothetical protein